MIPISRDFKTSKQSRPAVLGPLQETSMPCEPWTALELCMNMYDQVRQCLEEEINEKSSWTVVFILYITINGNRRRKLLGKIKQSSRSREDSGSRTTEPMTTLLQEYNLSHQVNVVGPVASRHLTASRMLIRAHQRMIQTFRNQHLRTPSP